MYFSLLLQRVTFRRSGQVEAQTNLMGAWFEGRQLALVTKSAPSSTNAWCIFLAFWGLLGSGLFLRSFSGAWRLPSRNTLGPAQIGICRPSSGSFSMRELGFDCGGSLFAAQRPPRKRWYFHDLPFPFSATASFATFSKGGPLQPIEMTGFAAFSQQWISRSHEQRFLGFQGGDIAPAEIFSLAED